VALQHVAGGLRARWTADSTLALRVRSALPLTPLLSADNLADFY
jgi:hypothetical protein